MVTNIDCRARAEFVALLVSYRPLALHAFCNESVACRTRAKYVTRTTLFDYLTSTLVTAPGLF